MIEVSPTLADRTGNTEVTWAQKVQHMVQHGARKLVQVDVFMTESHTRAEDALTTVAFDAIMHTDI